MPSLIDLIPDFEVLLGLAPEELGKVLLKVAKSNEQNGIFHTETVTTVVTGTGMAVTNTFAYPPQRMPLVEIAIIEAWQWLTIHMLIVPAPGINGRNGFMMFSRRGNGLINDGAFDSYTQAAAFPKELIHPLIADQVWIELARGNLDAAVFNSFKAVEVEVRNAANLNATDIGVGLMRKAFSPDNGPLSNMEQVTSEREALMHLFSGAIGSYKNPHSHRTVSLSDTREAQEMVMLATHLLRIVDARKVD